MHAFEEDGVIVFAQTFQQRAVAACLHYEGQKTELPDEGPAAFVLISSVAVIRKFRLGLPVAVLKAVQYTPAPLSLQGLDLVEYQDHPAVIRRVRNIESDNVKKHRATENCR